MTMSICSWGFEPGRERVTVVWSVCIIFAAEMGRWVSLITFGTAPNRAIGDLRLHWQDMDVFSVRHGRNMREKQSKRTAVVLAAALLGVARAASAGIAYDTSSRVSLTHDADVTNN